MASLTRILFGNFSMFLWRTLVIKKMWINEYYDIDIAYCYKFINNSWLCLEMFIFLWEKKTIKKALLLINPNPSVYSQRNKTKPNLNAYHVKNVTSWFFLCFDIFWFISLPIAYYVWKSRLEIKNLYTMIVFWDFR